MELLDAAGSVNEHPIERHAWPPARHASTVAIQMGVAGSNPAAPTKNIKK
jgi:hypothetical protein